MAVCMRAGGGGFDQFRMRLRVYCLAWVYGCNGAQKPRRNRVLWSRTHLIIAFIVDENTVSGIVSNVRIVFKSKISKYQFLQRALDSRRLPWKMGAQHGGPSCRNRSASMASQRGGVQWRTPRSQRHLQAVEAPRAYIRCILEGNNKVRFNPT